MSAMTRMTRKDPTKKSRRKPEQSAHPALLDSRTQYEERLARRRQSIAAFRATSNSQRTQAQRLADSLARWFGSLSFVMLHVVWFGGWIAWNLGWIPGLAPFDPFPFGLLTMVVSLEAIFLSAFILLSQNRQSDVSDLRGEINLTLNMVSDEKNSAILRTLTKMARQM
jgi:uncharacterized membrane protein